MSSRAGVGLALAVATFVALFLVARSARNARDARSRAARAAAIRSVFDPSRDSGWIETFETERTLPLSAYDRRWKNIFGNMLVNARLAAAIGDPEGGWIKDGGDDYAFRTTDVPSGSIEITLDGWFTGEGSLSAVGAAQAEAPHRFYEAALWRGRGRLSLIYFRGPAPDQFDVLAETPDLPVRRGYYRIVFRMLRTPDGWQLDARLLDPEKGYAVVGEVSATDNRLGDGGQGIGILSGGGTTHVTGLAVRTLPVATTGRRSP